MQACRRDACILAVLDRRVTVAAIDAVADVLRMTELDRFFLRHLYAKSMTVMSRSSAEPTVMPRARGNSAIRPGAVGGELLQPCRPRRDRSVRFRAFDDCVQDGNAQQTRARSVGNVAHRRGMIRSTHSSLIDCTNRSAYAFAFGARYGVCTMRIPASC